MKKAYAKWPTWEGSLNLTLAQLQHGDDEGRSRALIDLNNMAKCADKHNAFVQAISMVEMKVLPEKSPSERLICERFLQQLRQEQRTWEEWFQEQADLGLTEEPSKYYEKFLELAEEASKQQRDKAKANKQPVIPRHGDLLKMLTGSLEERILALPDEQLRPALKDYIARLNSVAAAPEELVEAYFATRPR
jgi:hypothetical protein